MKQRTAFTLVELLVVLAIIGILIAIIFPVFSSVQENARESSTMSHMEAIQSGIALYKLDNHKDPDSLLGYSDGIHPMSDAADVGLYNSSINIGTLYPTYVRDYHDFESSDNPVNNNTSATVSLTDTEPFLGNSTSPVRLCSADSVTYTSSPPSGTTLVPVGTYCPALVPITRTYYLMDAMDISPRIANIGTNQQFANGNSASNFQYVIRYQHDWTAYHVLQGAVTPQPPSTSGEPLDISTTYNADPYYTNYIGQMRWQAPPADAYVTSITYHVPNANRVLVLYDSGTVVKMYPTQYAKYSGSPVVVSNVYDDSTSCYNTVGGSETCTLNSSGDNPAVFWRTTQPQ